MLRLLYSSPVEIGVDEHAETVHQAIEEMDAQRVVVDSLKDIELATPGKVRYKDYLYSLVNDFRSKGITSLLTSEIPEMFGTFTVSRYGISFVADNVLLLRYVELESRVTRAISVLKMRGSDHDKTVREYRITGQNGLALLESFASYDAVLSGTTVTSQPMGVSLLPPRSRRLLRVLSQASDMTLKELVLRIREPESALDEALRSLVQLGYVVRYQRDCESVFKTAIV